MVASESLVAEIGVGVGGSGTVFPTAVVILVYSCASGSEVTCKMSRQDSNESRCQMCFLIR